MGECNKMKEKSICGIDECGEIVHALGLCGKHYRRLERNGTVELLSYPDRNNKGQFLKGLFEEKSPAYERVKRFCSFCGNELLVHPSRDKRAKNVFCDVKCKGNYQKGITGKNTPRWKGGRVGDGNGYIMIMSPEHPNSNNRGYVYEH